MSFPSASTATILIADDNPTNLKVAINAIANCGWEVLVATDGASAVEQATYAAPDLILLDVMMPQLNGFETCDRLKKNPATQAIPVIFMTALNDTVDKVQGFSLGAVDYITKPFQVEEVIARLKIHLQLRLLTRQLAERNEQLEQHVADRTAELSATLYTLQQSQLQLVQSEKMSTLGQLVAGIAHEINNPTHSIAGNLKHIDRYLNDLLHHVKLYQAKFPNPDAEIQADARNIELDYLEEDVPKLLLSMQESIKRIGGISTSLRTFSRSDITHKEPFNLHEGIDSTLMILKHRLKGNDQHPPIEVVQHYGDIPEVECYPGQINQVFMNIIANAIDALEESNQGRSYEAIEANPNQITIHTKMNAENSAEPTSVVIRIADNGPGIPESVKQRIFDHLFTTKSVGKGTGLGLSIARQIVEQRHHGTLACISIPGQGTEFIIELPIELEAA